VIEGLVDHDQCFWRLFIEHQEKQRVNLEVEIVLDTIPKDKISCGIENIVSFE